jgi:hypothetical protein
MAVRILGAMLKKLRVKVGRVAERIVGAQRSKDFREGRYHHFRGIAKKKYDKAVELRQEADKLRAKHPEQAAQLNGTANKREAQSIHAASKARINLGKVKRLNQKINDLDATKARLEARIKKLAPKPKVKGNKVVGGDWKQRLQMAMLTSAARCHSGARHNFYSQAGYWDIKHCITGPSPGHRDDCSSWFTSTYWTCNLADPNGLNYTAGFTGTIVGNWKQISREEARHLPGAAVIFGSGDGHHVEMAIGDGTEHTIGHGSDPVDMGTFDLLSDEVRFFAPPNHQFKLAA